MAPREWRPADGDRRQAGWCAGVRMRTVGRAITRVVASLLWLGGQPAGNPAEMRRLYAMFTAFSHLTNRVIRARRVQAFGQSAGRDVAWFPIQQGGKQTRDAAFLPFAKPEHEVGRLARVVPESLMQLARDHSREATGGKV